MQNIKVTKGSKGVVYTQICIPVVCVDIMGYAAVSQDVTWCKKHRTIFFFLFNNIFLTLNDATLIRSASSLDVRVVEGQTLSRLFVHFILDVRRFITSSLSISTHTHTHSAAPFVCC